MSTRTKIIAACLPFLAMAVFVLLLPQIQDGQLERLPLKSSVSTLGTEVISTRHTFSLGRYGVTDVGNLRLAFVDLPFPGGSSSELLLKSVLSFEERAGLQASTPESVSKGYENLGEGDHRFVQEVTEQGVRFQFGGVNFEIVDTTLTFDEETVDLVGPPTLLLFGRDRTLLETKPLKVP